MPNLVHQRPSAVEQARDEIAWLRFLVSREAVQFLARHLPLAQLRDHLPHFLTERLRLGLYPARVTDPLQVTCARDYPPWGTPVELDPYLPVQFAASEPTVSILIVTYGNLDLTRLCLASVQRAAGILPFEVIVVDNHSEDGTAEYLTAVQAQGLLPLRVVLSPHNLGFAAANNQAARLARGRYLVLLNNDTVVLPGWLEALTRALAADSHAGIVGPVTNSCGNEAQLGTPYHDLDGMRVFAADYTGAHPGERAEPGMLALFCAAMTKDLWNTVGGLDEGYGLGLFEDDDLAMAVRATGRKLVLLHDVFVHHYGGAAFSRLPPRQYLRLFWQNRRYFERKWNTTWQER